MSTAIAKKEFAERENKLRTIIESVPNGIVMADTNGKIVLCNSETERMFGYGKGELLGKPVETLVPMRVRSKHPEFRKGFVEKPSKRKMGAGRDLSGVCKDGTEIPVEIGLNHMNTDEGMFVIATIVDITERQQSEERYRLFVDSVKDYAMLMLDPNGRVLTWNEGAQRVKGYKAEEIVGQDFSRFYLPEDVKSGTPKKDLAIAANKGRCEVEGWRIRKDGSRFWANVVVTALRDSSGRLQGFGQVTRDLTERRKQEERFQSIVESVPNGIILVDQKGTIVLCNSDAEKLFGYSREELIGKSVETLVPARYQGNHPRDRECYMKNPARRQMGAGRDLAGRRKDGSEIPVEIGLNPMRTPEGSFVLASIVDITERKLIEEKLRKAIHARDEFLSIASHELKTPLTLLKLQAQLRKRNFDKNNWDAFAHDRLLKMIDDDEKQIDQLTHLVDDMLDISRLTSGKLNLVAEEFDICMLVQEVVKRFGPQLQTSHITINVDAACAVVGRWDRYRIEQIFTNLLVNAIKYGAGKPIYVSVTEQDGIVHLLVCDQGIGIAKKDQERIFHQFERAVTPYGISGLGLGLFIAKQLAIAHGGSIRVESEVGKGSSFIVSLPHRRG